MLCSCILESQDFVLEISWNIFEKPIQTLLNSLNHDLPQTPAPICLLPQSHSCSVASVPRQCGASSSSRGWVRPGCRSYQPPHPPPWNPSCLHATSMSARVQLQPSHAYFKTLLSLLFTYKLL